MQFFKDRLEFQGWIVSKAQARDLLSGRAARVVCECAACKRGSIVRDVSSTSQAGLLTAGSTTFSKEEVARIEKWLASPDTPPATPRSPKGAKRGRTRTERTTRRRAGARK